MSVIKNFSLRNTRITLFQAVLRCILTLFCISQIGCVVGRDYPTYPILYGILVEDWSTGVSEYRIATAQEWGEIQVIRKGIRLDVKPNMILKTNDRIRTGSDIAAVIRFPNGSQLYVRSNGDIKIGSVFAFVGELFIRVKGAFQVDTEFVTAGAEGTEWVMQVASNGDIRCTVLEGRVRVASTENLLESTLVIADRQYLMHHKLYVKMQLAPKEELNQMKRWISQIDRLTRDPQSFPNDNYNRSLPFNFNFDFHRQRTDQYPRENKSDRPDRTPYPSSGSDRLY